VRVVRFNDSKGSKPNWPQERWGQHKKQIGWLVGIEGVIAHEDIPIYHDAEVRKAIANNEFIGNKLKTLGLQSREERSRETKVSQSNPCFMRNTSYLVNFLYF